MNNIDYHELRERVRELKYKKRLTQHGIAQLLGVRNTYLSDMLNGRVPVTESVSKKIYELISDTQPQPKSDAPTQPKVESEAIIWQQLIQEKDKTIALLEENAALYRKQVQLLEEKVAFFEKEYTKKIADNASSRKNAGTADVRAIFPQL